MLEFKKVLDYFGKWSYHYRNRERYGVRCKPLTNAYICDNLLHKFLEENDYLEKSMKSPTKILSKIPKELIGYFLLGMVDGDGCFYFKENQSSQFTIAETSKQDWSSIDYIFKSYKIKYTIVVTKSSSVIRVTNKNDIRKIGNFVYSTIEDDNIGLRRKYEKYKQIVSSLIENDELVEYVKNNKDKKIKQLLNELNISRFKLNRILKSIN
jgi:hypothetical protein